jgi:uncharacterized protein YceH (UPF0502 family)
METLLSAIEARVLGSLMEKARTTPEAYPLTLNALVNACNQKTSRDPVTDYDDDEVMDALDSLREKRLVMRVDVAGSRTAKFRENASLEWQLERPEYALLATLLLRGPQTPGQLRQRSERMYPFGDLQQVTDLLAAMQQREEEPLSLVRSLGRAAGAKEIRYAQTVPELDETAFLAAGPAAPQAPAGERPPRPQERMDALEVSMQQLQERLARLEALLDELTS